VKGASALRSAFRESFLLMMDGPCSLPWPGAAKSLAIAVPCVCPAMLASNWVRMVWMYGHAFSRQECECCCCCSTLQLGMVHVLVRVCLCACVFVIDSPAIQQAAYSFAVRCVWCESFCVVHALLRSMCCGLATLLLWFSRVAKPQSMLPQPYTGHHIGARQVTASDMYLSTVELTTLSEQQLVDTSHVFTLCCMCEEV
jgi:hypothetical protein